MEDEKYKLTKSHNGRNAGVLKNTAPLPITDPLHRPEGYPYLRAPENCSYMLTSTLVEEIFDSKMNIFITSISGTLLMTLKVLAKAVLCEKAVFDDQEKCKNFVRLVIAALQFNSGGHSYFEFCKVFEIAEIQTFFKQNQNIDLSALDVVELFLRDNQATFEEALSKSIAYNDQLLARAAVRQTLATIPVRENENIAPSTLQKTRKP